jgi:hypothetical protein
MPTPDFDRLIAEANTNRKPVPLDQAKLALGDLFDDVDLSQETLVIRGGSDFSLTPTAWIRVVRQAKERVGKPE